MVECANHACKCHHDALEQLVKSNSSFKASGGLTLKMRKRLVNAAQCAIRMRSQEKDRAQALILLRKDHVNRHRHCFGIHTHCSFEQQPTSEDGEDPDDGENDLGGYTHSSRLMEL